MWVSIYYGDFSYVLSFLESFEFGDDAPTLVCASFSTDSDVFLWLVHLVGVSSAPTRWWPSGSDSRGNSVLPLVAGSTSECETLSELKGESTVTWQWEIYSIVCPPFFLDYLGSSRSVVSR